MPRKAAGTVLVSRGALFASVIVAPRKRLARALHGVVDASDRAAAQAWASALQELVDALRAAGRSAEIATKVDLAIQVGRDDPRSGLKRVRAGVAKLRAGHAADALSAATTPRGVTFKKFGERWTSGELHREYPDHVEEKKTADDDVSRLKKYVYPIVGHVPLHEFTLEHAQEVLRRVPREASSSTRRHVAQLMVRICHLAVYPARVLTASPLPRGFLPKVGAGKALTFLYPIEERDLLRCRRVPLAFRLLYGVLAREGLRAGEALALTWSDLDLKHGAIRLDENKTDDPRAWALDAGVMRALEWWRVRQGDPAGKRPVFPDLPDNGHLADALRGHLQEAGVKRPELFEDSKTRRKIRVHDLRATFITIALANGKTETWIADRTGHRSSIMINRYRRVARTAAELGLGALAPLDKAIPEIAAAKKKSRRPRAA